MVADSFDKVSAKSLPQKCFGDRWPPRPSALAATTCVTSGDAKACMWRVVCNCCEPRTRRPTD